MQNLARSYQTRLDLSESYQGQLLTAVRRLEHFARRRLRPADFSAELVAGFLTEYLRTHSPATVNSKRGALLRLWSHAHRQGLCRPPQEIPKACEIRRIPTAWTVTEVERLLAECRKQPGTIAATPARFFWPSLVLAVYDTGARIGALRSAHTADFDAGERRLLIRGEHVKSRTDCVYWLSDQTTAAIAAIVPTCNGRLWDWPHHRRWLWNRFRRIVEAAGLQADKRGMSLFHKLRRTTLSYCAAVDLDLARQQAGHASAATTLRHYVDPRIASRRSAVDVLPRPRESAD